MCLRTSSFLESGSTLRPPLVIPLPSLYDSECFCLCNATVNRLSLIFNVRRKATLHTSYSKILYFLVLVRVSPFFGASETQLTNKAQRPSKVPMLLNWLNSLLRSSIDTRRVHFFGQTHSNVSSNCFSSIRCPLELMCGLLLL